MHSHSTSKLLDLKDSIINKVSHSDSAVRIMISSRSKPICCPACRLHSSKTHDYPYQTIKDLHLMAKKTYSFLETDGMHVPVVNGSWNPMIFYQSIVE